MKVDGNFAIGVKTAMKNTMEKIVKYIEIKRSHNVEDYFGCKIRRDGRTNSLFQLNLIEKLCLRFKVNVRSHNELRYPKDKGFFVPETKKENSPRGNKKIAGLEWDHYYICLNILDPTYLIASNH
jgi:hypothetical protein